MTASSAGTGYHHVGNARGNSGRVRRAHSSPMICKQHGRTVRITTSAALATQEAHVVVTPIVMISDQHAAAEAGKKAVGEMKGSGRKSKSTRGAEMGEPGNNHPQNGGNHAYP